MDCEARWLELHHMVASRGELPPLLAERWSACDKKHIPFEVKRFPAPENGDFYQIKQQSILLYAYANRFITQISKYLTNPEITFALFNAEGVMLKLYGNSETCSQLSLSGLQRMSDWSEQAIGVNAVSLGLATNTPAAVCGSENYSRLLIDKAVYFAPCALDRETANNSSLMMGGVAVIAPLEKAHPDYLMTVVAAANDIVLHIFMADSLHKAYYSDESGMITIDINVKTGKSSLIYHDSNIFKVFDIPYMNLYFKKTEMLFDPPPANQRFWEILQNKEQVVDQKINLTIMGHTEQYFITSEAYHQKNLALSGLRFWVTSPRNLSLKISKSIGNNAVFTFDNIIGNSSAIVNAIKQAKSIAKIDNHLLIFGESGTGKDIFAQAVHNACARNKQPFLVFNCSAYPRDSLPQMLFGYHSSDSFKDNIGKLELAHTGTIFLDDIDALPIEVQAQLLLVMERGWFSRIGSSEPISCDVKIIAATSANLAQMIAEKKFRSDLFYQLNTLHLTLPPLRERGHDAVLLAEWFIKVAQQRVGHSRPITLHPETKKLISRLPWSGNVRELQNTIEGIVQINQTLSVIEPIHIINSLSSSGTLPQCYEDYGTFRPMGTRSLTREMLRDALETYHYNKSLTANKLGISRRTVYRYIEKWKLCDPSDPHAHG